MVDVTRTLGYGCDEDPSPIHCWPEIEETDFVKESP
jgi:hypothetical protein